MLVIKVKKDSHTRIEYVNSSCVESWKKISDQYIFTISKRDRRIKISVDSLRKPNNVSPYFEAFVSIFLPTMVNIGRGSRVNIQNSKFNS